MKKKLALALAAVMMIGLFAGCGGNKTASSSNAAGSQASSGSAAQAEELNVGVFYYDFSDVYISSVRASMDEQLTAMGVKFTNYDAAGSQPSQTEQVNTAITGGTNLLIVNIVETATSDPAKDIVDAAKAAGIPVIFFNREVADNDVINSYDKCAFVGTNAPDAGHMQGEMIGNYLMEHYDEVDLNGDGVISYVMFKGQEGNAEAEARTQYGVEDADAILTAAGKPALSYYDASASTKYLVDTAGKWSAQAANDYMVSLLGSYNEDNGNMVELIICNNDGMAEGAISALQNVGYNNGEGTTIIPVFGVDATDSAKALIKAGNMTGSIKQDAVGMATTIMTLVQNAKDGAELMANTGSFTVDADVAKIRVPYAMYDANTQD
ncbi:galactose ABC transporter substrate-binding protein [Pseudoflavonifractor phocaeensis]|uniref:galactose ABC transporter substrate-binding protein n=1 Tax=Pseudoflavonifractor phocaeensis TaxID=1870988 RepID=UPI001F1EED15|nr:galactose ABC transporter substrate-binding protein [Pseudoflavonifractor phocaeensis]MCF2661306.1 galactose ABC transporter substrate-binding protein [Pseudoflavonifractor phocaeensis]